MNERVQLNPQPPDYMMSIFTHSANRWSEMCSKCKNNLKMESVVAARPCRVPFSLLGVNQPGDILHLSYCSQIPLKAAVGRTEKRVDLAWRFLQLPGPSRRVARSNSFFLAAFLHWSSSVYLYLSCKLLLTKEGRAAFSFTGCSVVVCPPLHPLTEDMELNRVSACAVEEMAMWHD